MGTLAARRRANAEAAADIEARLRLVDEAPQVLEENKASLAMLESEASFLGDHERELQRLHPLWHDSPKVRDRLAVLVPVVGQIPAHTAACRHLEAKAKHGNDLARRLAKHDAEVVETMAGFDGGWLESELQEAEEERRAASEALVHCQAVVPRWPWDRMAHSLERRRKERELQKAEEKVSRKRRELSSPEGRTRLQTARDTKATDLGEIRRQLLDELAACQTAQAAVLDARRQLSEAKAAEAEVSSLQIELAAIEDAENKARACDARRKNALAAQAECERLQVLIAHTEKEQHGRAGLEKQLRRLREEADGCARAELDLGLALRIAHSEVAVAEGDLLLLGDVCSEPPEAIVAE